MRKLAKGKGSNSSRERTQNILWIAPVVETMDARNTDRDNAQEGRGGKGRGRGNSRFIPGFAIPTPGLGVGSSASSSGFNGKGQSSTCAGMPGTLETQGKGNSPYAATIDYQGCSRSRSRNRNRSRGQSRDRRRSRGRRRTADAAAVATAIVVAPVDVVGLTKKFCYATHPSPGPRRGISLDQLGPYRHPNDSRRSRCTHSHSSHHSHSVSNHCRRPRARPSQKVAQAQYA
jgi:hypothetical protein